jgi:orotate phosphoribosyltransferase
MLTIIGDDEYRALHAWGRDFIDTHCIERRKPSDSLPGKLPGSTYTWMFYLRRGMFNSDFASAVSKMFLYKVAKERGRFPFQLAGLESGAVPILSSITVGASLLYGLHINAFAVRKERKEYGLRNWIEGTPIPGAPVMLVDDLCNSSTSMKRCYDVCMAHGLPISRQAFCIVNKVNKAVHSRRRAVTDMYLPDHIQMLSLYDLDDFNLSNPSH